MFNLVRLNVVLELIILIIFLGDLFYFLYLFNFGFFRGFFGKNGFFLGVFSVKFFYFGFVIDFNFYVFYFIGIFYRF